MKVDGQRGKLFLKSSKIIANLDYLFINILINKTYKLYRTKLELDQKLKIH